MKKKRILLSFFLFLFPLSGFVGTHGIYAQYADEEHDQHGVTESELVLTSPEGEEVTHIKKTFVVSPTGEEREPIQGRPEEEAG